MAHPVTEKVWGSETLIVNRAFCGKVMTLRKGYRCSLHYHRAKDETFLVLEGRMRVEIGLHGRAEYRTDPIAPGLQRCQPSDHSTRVVDLGPGEAIDVPPGTLHRFTGLTDCRFVEFSTHDEASDSYRLVKSGPAPT